MAKKKSKSRKKRTLSQKQKSTVAAANTSSTIDTPSLKDVNKSGTSNNLAVLENTSKDDSTAMTGTKSTPVYEHAQIETKGDDPASNEVKSVQPEVPIETKNTTTIETHIPKTEQLKGEVKSEATTQNNPVEVKVEQIVEEEEQIEVADKTDPVEEKSEVENLLKEEEENDLQKDESSVGEMGSAMVQGDPKSEESHAQSETISESTDDQAKKPEDSTLKDKGIQSEECDAGEKNYKGVIPAMEDSETESESTEDDAIEAKVMVRDLDTMDDLDTEPVDEIVKKNPSLESQYVDCMESIFSIFGLSRLIWEYWVSSGQTATSMVESEAQSEKATTTDSIGKG